jgi:cytoskeletal protein CcmA (bactofilin family)
MFESKKASESSKVVEIDPNSRNLIGAGTSITGDLSSDGVVRMDGSLKGNLVTKSKLVLGTTGSIIGDVRCKSADIEGTVEGKIYASEILSLKSTAKIKGEIYIGKLAVEPGAVFNGTCVMNGSAEIEKLSAAPQNGKKAE